MSFYWVGSSKVGERPRRVALFRLDPAQPVIKLEASMETQGMGERLRDLRVKKELTLRELARRVDISPSFLSEIETGRSYPSDPVLERLAEELGVTLAGMRSLDMRSHLSDLRKLLDSDASWGPVFQQIAKKARSGKLSPAELMKRLGE